MIEEYGSKHLEIHQGCPIKRKNNVPGNDVSIIPGFILKKTLDTKMLTLRVIIQNYFQFTLEINRLLRPFHASRRHFKKSVKT